MRPDTIGSLRFAEDVYQGGPLLPYRAPSGEVLWLSDLWLIVHHDATEGDARAAAVRVDVAP